VNSATNAFQINGLPSRDLDGGERVVGSNMDRGAYETDVDDRTTFIVTTSAPTMATTPHPLPVPCALASRPPTVRAGPI
jgi:hypothetical protein